MKLTVLMTVLMGLACCWSTPSTRSGQQLARSSVLNVHQSLATASAPALGPQDEVRQRFGETLLAGRYVLRWGMEVGQRFQVQATQEIVSEISGPLGSSGKRPTGLTLWLDWEVQESDDTSMTLLQTFRQLRMGTTIPGVGKVVVDTKEPAPAAIVAARLHADLQALVGRQMQLQMDRLGNVKKLTLVPCADDDGTEESNRAIGQESLKTILGQMVQFPKTTRALGETWGTTVKTPQPGGTAEISTEYTLVEMLPEHPEQIRITVIPKLTLTTKDDAIRLVEQSAEGYLVYDDRLALVRETSLKQELKFSFSGEGGGQQTVQSTMTLKIEPVQPPTNDGG
jgi:hypothetical protein